MRRASEPTRVLFVAWDGPDASYLESLFLPTFARLADHGFAFRVIQFGWGPPNGSQRAADRFAIPYRRVRVHQRLKVAGAAEAVLRGAAVLRRALTGVDILMPRAIPPAAMARLARRPDTRVLFDADGLVADERVDFAGWSPSSPMTLAYRAVEAGAVRDADAVVTRTRAARDILLARAGAGTDPRKVFPIPNGIDEDVFRPADEGERRRARAALSLDPNAFVVVHVGSLGPQYYPAAMLRFFRALRQRRDDARLVLLTAHRQVAERAVADAGVDPRSVRIERVPPSEVPARLAAADLGLALRQASFSQRGVSPIKVGEYLLSGLPVLATRGVGDLDRQLGTGAVGLLLDGVEDRRLEAAVAWALREVAPNPAPWRLRCRRVGVAEFGLAGCARRLAEALRFARGEGRAEASSGLADVGSGC